MMPTNQRVDRNSTTGKSRDGIWIGFLLALAAGMPTLGQAQILEDIDTRSEQGVTEFRLQFSVPVQYLRHFPEDRGELIKLYLQSAGLEGEDPVRIAEFKRSPKSASAAPPFKVLYTTVRDCFATSNPICLDIQFNHPVHFRIRPGSDGRSILLIVLPDVESPSSSAPKH